MASASLYDALLFASNEERQVREELDQVSVSIRRGQRRSEELLAGLAAVRVKLAAEQQLTVRLESFARQRLAELTDDLHGGRGRRSSSEEENDAGIVPNSLLRSAHEPAAKVRRRRDSLCAELVRHVSRREWLTQVLRTVNDEEQQTRDTLSAHSTPMRAAAAVDSGSGSASSTPQSRLAKPASRSRRDWRHSHPSPSPSAARSSSWRDVGLELAQAQAQPGRSAPQVDPRRPWPDGGMDGTKRASQVARVGQVSPGGGVERGFEAATEAVAVVEVEERKGDTVPSGRGWVTTSAASGKHQGADANPHSGGGAGGGSASCGGAEGANASHSGAGAAGEHGSAVGRAIRAVDLAAESVRSRSVSDSCAVADDASDHAAGTLLLPSCPARDARDLEAEMPARNQLDSALLERVAELQVELRDARSVLHGLLGRRRQLVLQLELLIYRRERAAEMLDAAVAATPEHSRTEDCAAAARGGVGDTCMSSCDKLRPGSAEPPQQCGLASAEATAGHQSATSHAQVRPRTRTDDAGSHSGGGSGRDGGMALHSRLVDVDLSS